MFFFLILIPPVPCFIVLLHLSLPPFYATVCLLIIDSRFELSNGVHIFVFEGLCHSLVQDPSTTVISFCHWSSLAWMLKTSIIYARRGFWGGESDINCTTWCKPSVYGNWKASWSVDPGVEYLDTLIIRASGHDTPVAQTSRILDLFPDMHFVSTSHHCM